IITFGVDPEAFHPAAPGSKSPDRALTVGYVGRMLPGKGLNVLVEALSKLKDENWRLSLVGDGPECGITRQRLRECDLADRAVFTGSIAYEDVPELFRRLDILVMPTQTTSRIREQFGRVLVEAMASGVAVIGSTCGAIPEVIDNAGIVFAEGDAGELASGL